MRPDTGESAAMPEDSRLSTPSAALRLPVAHPAWRGALVALLLVLAWVLVWYRDAAVGMVSIWARSETFTHGFVVAPVALWLIWQRRAELGALAPRPAFGVLPLVALVGVAWLLGELATVNAVTQFALVALLVLGTWAVLGTRVARRMAFPLGFLFFAVPIGSFMLPTLMEWTADFTVAALQLSGVPVYREGQHFSIPTGNWSVVEACSGVRYLIASLMIGTVYAYLSYRSTARRLAFIGVSIVVPIVANWLRAYMIVMLGHLSGNRIAVGVDHLIYGWLFFGVVMALMFWIGSRWREDGPPSASASVATTGTTTVAPPPPGAARFGVMAAAFAVVVMAWPLAGAWLDGTPAHAKPALAPLVDVPGWRGDAATADLLRPRFTGAAAELSAGFQGSSVPVGLYVGYYRDQDHERKLVSSENVIVTSENSRWAVTTSGRRATAVGSENVAARVTRLRSAAQRLVVWHWYWIDGTLTASDIEAKLITARSQLTHRRDDSAVIVVYAPEGRPGEAERALEGFLREAWPAIDQRLRAARDGTGAAGR